MKFNIFFFLLGLSVCVLAFVHISGVSNSLALLLFGPLLLSSQGPLALSKVVKHENETLVYLTFSFVQMSHSICDALHMFLTGTFGARLAYTFGANTREMIGVESSYNTCGQICKMETRKCPLISIYYT